MYTLYKRNKIYLEYIHACHYDHPTDNNLVEANEEAQGALKLSEIERGGNKELKKLPNKQTR